MVSIEYRSKPCGRMSSPNIIRRTAHGRVQLGARLSISECSMPETDRLSEPTELTGLEVVERERTPGSTVQVGIRLRLACLSSSSTNQYIEKLGVDRSRTPIHGRVRKADLQPDNGMSPNQILGDETVIRVNGQRHWLFVVVTQTRTEFSTFECFRHERRNSRCCSVADFVRNSRSRI
jgi:hypothetical protein